MILPVVGVSGSCRPSEDCPRDDDVVWDAGGGPCAPVSRGVRAGHSVNSVGHHIILSLCKKMNNLLILCLWVSDLNAAVALLSPDAVLVVHSLDLSQPGVVVALDSPSQPSEVLEAAHLGSHVLVVTTELRHLGIWNSTNSAFCSICMHVTLIFHWLLVLSPTVKLIVPWSVSVGLRSM